MRSVIYPSLLSLLLPYLNVFTSAHSDGYIGCFLPTSYMDIIYIDANNGSVCKKHCFPQYIYAGTKLDNCYCGFTPSESKINESKCSFRCPGQPYNRTCGGTSAISMYNIHETELKSEDGQPSWSVHNHNYFVNPVTDSYRKETDGTSTFAHVPVHQDSSQCIVVTSSIAFGLLILLILVLITYRCTSKPRSRKGVRRRAQVGQYISPTSRATDLSLNSNAHRCQTSNVMTSSVFEQSYI